MVLKGTAKYKEELNENTKHICELGRFVVIGSDSKNNENLNFS